MVRALLGTLGLLVLVAPDAPVQSEAASPSGIVGTTFTHTVRSGDSLTAVSARFGVELSALAAMNNLRRDASLRLGQTLLVDNRHLIPSGVRAGLTINIPQRMLFLTTDDRVAGYPVSVGRPGWATPIAEFQVLTKEEDPVWDVPRSIQEEMRREGRPVVTRVLPGPGNPLGRFWLGLSLPNLGIHGTNAPSSIYRLATHGCIRLSPENADIVFAGVAVGTPGRIIYEPAMLASVNGRVFVEVHRDGYSRQVPVKQVLIERANALRLFASIDWLAVDRATRAADGTVVDVTDELADP